MEWNDRLDAVQNDRIGFVTMRPPGSPFTTLDRRVVLTGPPEVLDLAATGDPQVLAALIDLLRDPARAWAAEVVLAALTRQEEKQVDAFAATPDAWWTELGPGAYDRWRTWLDANRDRLAWDAAAGSFVAG